MKRLYPDATSDFGEDTDPGLPSCTIIGPPLAARAPAPRRIPYHERYPPVLDAPLELVMDDHGCVAGIVGRFDEFDFGDDDSVVIDPDPPEHFALGSHSKGRKP